MAHAFSIPALFEFRPRRVIWSSWPAEITGWSETASNDPAAAFSVRVPGSSPFKRVSVGRGFLPPNILSAFSAAHRSQPFDLSAFDSKERTMQLLALAHTSKVVNGALADAWDMRDQFLRMKQRHEDLVDFLDRWGLWSAHGFNAATILDRPPMVLANAAECVVPAQVWEFQAFCRAALNRPAASWLGSYDAQTTPLRRPEYPHFLWYAEAWNIAIKMTITIDFLRKVKFKLCARRDCAAPFKIESKHSRRYCSQYCAHLESVRKNRRLQRKIASSAELSATRKATGK